MLVAAHVPEISAVVLTAVAGAFDLQRGRIPDALNAAGAAVGLVFAATRPADVLLTAVLAGSVGAVALYAVRLLGQAAYGQPGMGWGDVKLAGALGALLGWNALWALYLAAVFGAVLGMAGRASGRTGRLQRIPFAPFIAAGTVIAAVIDVDVLWRYVASP